MKFGKLANLKKWHLLWVAGRQVWLNRNGNEYHCQNWDIGLGYCCQFFLWTGTGTVLVGGRSPTGSGGAGVSGGQESHRRPPGELPLRPTHGLRQESHFPWTCLCICAFEYFVFSYFCTFYTDCLPQALCHKMGGNNPVQIQYLRSFTVRCWFWIPSLFILELNKSMLSPQTSDGVQANVWRNALNSAHELCSPMQPQFVLAWYMLGA